MPFIGLESGPSETRIVKGRVAIKVVLVPEYFQIIFNITMYIVYHKMTASCGADNFSPDLMFTADIGTSVTSGE